MRQRGQPRGQWWQLFCARDERQVCGWRDTRCDRLCICCCCVMHPWGAAVAAAVAAAAVGCITNQQPGSTLRTFKPPRLPQGQAGRCGGRSCSEGRRNARGACCACCATLHQAADGCIQKQSAYGCHPPGLLCVPNADGMHPHTSPTRPTGCAQIFRRMHAAFVDAVSNPFYQQGAPLASPRFDASIRTIATSLGAS